MSTFGNTSSNDRAFNAQRLALGTVQFGLPYGIANNTGQVAFSQAKKMLHFSADCGMDTVDTAIGYGNSEEILGRIGVEKFKIISKLPSIPKGLENIKKWVIQEMELSLKRLRVERLYGLLLHRPLDLLDDSGYELYVAIQHLKNKGIVSKIGISVYSPVEYEKCTADFEFDLIQAPLNLVDRRLDESGLLKRLKEKNYEIHVRSVFLQGLLLVPPEKIPEKFLRWKFIWSNWKDWLNEFSGDALGACLSYPLSLSEIDRIIVGSNNLQQLQQIAIAASSYAKYHLPNISSMDENLINPAKWV